MGTIGPENKMNDSGLFFVPALPGSARKTLFAALVCFAVVQTASAALSISSVSSVSCAASGTSIPVTFSYAGATTAAGSSTLRYIIGFSSQNAANGSPISWTGGFNCGSAGYTKTVTFLSSTGSVTQSVTVPTTGFTVSNLIVVARQASTTIRCGTDAERSIGFQAPCPPPTSTPTAIPTATFTPIPCYTPVGADDLNLQGGVYCCATPSVSLLTDTTVFDGLALADVKNIADFVGTSLGSNPVTLNVISDMKLSYFTGNLVYGSPNTTKPYDRLNSSGVLVVDGDLTLNGPSSGILPSTYLGIVFVTGNLIVRDGSEIDGVVIMGKPYYHKVSGVGVKGNLTLSGSAGNYGQIIYSPSIVTAVQQQVGQYRENISNRKLLLAVPNL